MPEMCLDLIDEARAYFHATARRDAHVELPKEDHEEEMRSKIKKAMNGARDAAHNLELEYTELMVEAGFSQGSYRACVFYHKEKNVRAAGHGDDFGVLRSIFDLDWLREVIQRRMEVKYKSAEKKARSGEDVE